MFRFFLYLILTLVSTPVLSAETDLRAITSSSDYTAKALPSEWLPQNPPPTNHRLSEFLSWPFETMQIRDLIAHFGVPDRYLVSSRQNLSNYLAYDLADGAIVVFYVTEPPYNKFSAGAVFDARDNLLRLVK